MVAARQRKQNLSILNVTKIGRLRESESRKGGHYFVRNSEFPAHGSPNRGLTEQTAKRPLCSPATPIIADLQCRTLQEFNHLRLLFPELSVILTCHVVLASFSCIKSFSANLPMMVLWKIVTEVTEIRNHFVAI
jgi:hypothetical protein